MKPHFLLPFLSLIPASLLASSVVITSVPDVNHPISPLTSPAGLPLPTNAEVLVGAFPGMTRDQLLNAAASGGLTQISTSFIQFGAPQKIGDGVDGASGMFEIFAQRDTSAPTSVWVGEKISLLIRQIGGQEFLVLQFPEATFQADTETGLDPLLSLHLADAAVIIGNNYGSASFSTSLPPSQGTFTAWINFFTSITDPTLRLQEADADGDGRSNYLEYVTGGDPTSPSDPPAGKVVEDDAGDFWFRISRATGVGSVNFTVQFTPNFVTPWMPLEGTFQPDPTPPTEGRVENWVRIRIPESLSGDHFFRLSATPSSE